MFGRRRRRTLEHDRVVPSLAAHAAPPRLTREQLLEVVRTHLDESFGQNGSWTLVRRRGDDTDAFFHRLAAESLAHQIVDALERRGGANASRTALPDAPPAHRAPVDEPAPIARTTGPAAAGGAADDGERIPAQPELIAG